MGGRQWALGDYISLSGFVVVGETSYEIKDVRGKNHCVGGKWYCINLNT